MGELINFYFNGDGKELILIITFGAIGLIVKKNIDCLLIKHL